VARIGQMPKIEAQFSDAGGPADPDVVTLTIRAPDGTETTPTPVRVSAGLYRYYLLLEQSGVYLWSYVGTGTVFERQEGAIEVERSLFEPELGTAVRDYFTRAEFRAFTHDDEPEPRYDDSDIDDAQSEAIEALEAWARSSWATVTGVDGDGTAAEYRTAVERVTLTSRGRLILGRRPLHAVTQLQTVPIGADPSDVDPNTYDANLSSAILSFAPGLAWGAGGAWITTDGDVRVPWPTQLAEFQVAYEYGFGTTPRSVKVPVMKAVRTRLDETLKTAGSGGSSRIPANTRSLTSSRATLEFGDRTSPDDDLPWPWDPAASAEIRGLWERSRPRQVFSIVGG